MRRHDDVVVAGPLEDIAQPGEVCRPQRSLPTTVGIDRIHGDETNIADIAHPGRRQLVDPEDLTPSVGRDSHGWGCDIVDVTSRADGRDAFQRQERRG